MISFLARTLEYLSSLSRMRVPLPEKTVTNFKLLLNDQLSRTLSIVCIQKHPRQKSHPAADVCTRTSSLRTSSQDIFLASLLFSGDDGKGDQARTCFRARTQSTNWDSTPHLFWALNFWKIWNLYFLRFSAWGSRQPSSFKNNKRLNMYISRRRHILTPELK